MESLWLKLDYKQIMLLPSKEHGTSKMFPSIELILGGKAVGTRTAYKIRTDRTFKARLAVQAF